MCNLCRFRGTVNLKTETSAQKNKAMQWIKAHKLEGVVSTRIFFVFVDSSRFTVQSLIIRDPIVNRTTKDST